MTLPSSNVSLRFADGAEITSFLSFELTERFLDPLDRFRCVLAPTREHRKDYLERLQKGELISLLVDEKPQAAMYIQSCNRKIDVEGGHIIHVDAISPLVLLFESTVNPGQASKILEADAPVLNFVLSLVEPFGFTEVYDQNDVAALKSKTGVNPKSTATAAANARQAKSSADSNETVYEFINRVLKRLGCILRCDPSTAALYITAPHYDGSPLYTVKQATSGSGPVGDRFFGTVEIRDTNADQYSFCEVIGESVDEIGERRANIPRARATTADINSRRPPFRASGPFPYKPCFYKDKNVGSRQRAVSMAKHTLGKRAEDAFSISGTVHGLVNRNGIPWTVDTLGRVFIEAEGIDETMWLSARTMHQAVGGGQYTSMMWLPKGNVVLGDIASS